MVGASRCPSSILLITSNSVEDISGILLVLLQNEPISIGAPTQAATLSHTLNIENVRDAPAIIEGVNHEQRALNERVHILGEHAPPQLVLVLLVAAGHGGSQIHVGQFLKVDELVAVVVLVAGEVDNIQEHTRVRNGPHIALNL